VAPWLRFLTEDELRAIDAPLVRNVTIDDFIGARCVADLPSRALDLARVAGALDITLAAQYLRELIPPTDLDDLRADALRISEDLRAVLDRCEQLKLPDLVRIELCLNRRLRADEFEHSDSLETLPPKALDLVRELGDPYSFMATMYVRELVRGEDRTFSMQFVDEVNEGRAHLWRSPPPSDN
jgi:hypothetical protein